jgi:hypothetical protein
MTGATTLVAPPLLRLQFRDEAMSMPVLAEEKGGAM